MEIGLRVSLELEKKKESYGGGGGDSNLEGFHVNPSMLPIKPSRKPMNKPPAAPNQLNIENISTRTAPVLTLFLSSLFIIIAPTSTKIPQTIPRTPRIIIALPSPPKPIKSNMPPMRSSFL